LVPLLYVYLPKPSGPVSSSLEIGGDVPANNIAQLFREGRAVPTLLLWTAFFSNLLVMYFLVNWLPSLLSIAGSSLSVATLSTALLNLGGIFGAVLLSRLINGAHALIVLACAYGVAALALLLIARAEGNVPILLTGAGVAGAVVVGGQIAMNAVTASFYPTQIRSTGVGWALGIGRVGSIVGPLLGGLLLGAGWQETSAVMFAIIPTLIAACALLGVSRFLNRIG
jgi:MFS transporter, AAHS family, 4-hydroxybenzoate transporter